MSWKPQVLVDGEWSGNALVFETKEEAERWGRDLLMRWIIPTDSRAVESTETPNYRCDVETGATVRIAELAE
jgi:hypothetical protein